VQPNTMLAAALRYAKAGWPVFPCKQGEKTPAGYLVPNGVLDATTDEPQIMNWWASNPNLNVAIATGYPGPDVVDFDVKNDKADGENSYHKLNTVHLLGGSFAIMITPSGGAHVYFAGTEQHNGALAKVGVDFRSKGGYVLAPPSHVTERDELGVVTSEGDYVVLKRRDPTGVPAEWQRIKDFLIPPAAPRIASATGSPSSRINAVIKAMREQPQEGERNHFLYWAANRLVECDASDNDFMDLYAAAEATGMQDEKDGISKTIKSARR